MYKNIDPKLLPSSENLSDVIARLKPLWEEKISKDIRDKKNVLIVAHGSSFRALSTFIRSDNFDDNKMMEHSIPHALPFVMGLDSKLSIVSG
jgi:2,3-bisphosphoglycerate-dependent phosphoglycerate mutase